MKRTTDSTTKWLLSVALIFVFIAATSLSGCAKGCDGESSDEETISEESEDDMDEADGETGAQDVPRDAPETYAAPADTPGGESRQPRQLRLKTQAKDAAERMNRNPYE